MKHKKRLPARRWLEAVGTILLVYGVYAERHVLGRSFHTIEHARVWPMLICFLLTWLLFVWSALGYKSLLKKPVCYWHIVLAHIAAGGPGRVIPGGAGYLSFGTLFLRKNGLRLPEALAVAVSANAAGLAINSLTLALIFIFDHGVLAKLHLSAPNAAAGMAVLAAVMVVLLVARRSRRFKKGSDQTGKAVKHIWRLLRREPQRMVLLTAAALGTIATNGLMLHFAAQAVGLGLPVGAAIVVISTGVALGSLIPTPGGVGGVEAGLIASLYALGANLELATSAALLYRFATYALPLLPGVGAYLALRRKQLL